MSGIIPCRNKLNAKARQVSIQLKNETNKKNICLIDNSNINDQYNCNKSAIQLSKGEANKVIENMFFAFSKFVY